jgi:DNA mismatch repair protein MutS2
MVALFKRRPDFAIEPFDEILPLLDKAIKRATLAGLEIRAFLPLIRSSEKIRRIYLAVQLNEASPIWADLPAALGLSELIDDAIDDEGQVRPNATPEIERLFKAVNSARQSIRAKAEALLRDEAVMSMLQDEYVTLREGRFVLPVKAEHKSHVDGIIHDSSHTGHTYFIEPKALVEMNNRLRSLEMELAVEVARLFADLTAMIAGEADSITALYKEVTRLDLISAKATIAVETESTRPLFGRRLELKSARNPVMVLEGGTPIPNDMAMPESARVLVISGPNTGGKTVAMKTIGALCMMARMGLFIPSAEGSTLPFYRSIFADIGDSQSISDNLSTFSAHLMTMKDIIANAREGSLVLLDELMVSTDPKEGSALAAAVLDWLVKAGADIVVTTHFRELKALAQVERGYHNVAMQFDDEMGSPTYRMVSGVAGASSAIAVAERLGLPKEIITSAKNRLEGGDERIEKAIAELREEKIRLEDATRKAQELEVKTRQSLEESERVKEELIAQKEDLKKNAKRKLSADIQTARNEISKLIEETRARPGDREILKKNIASLEKMAVEAREAAVPEERIAGDSLKPGDTVYVTALERKGVVITGPSDGRVDVEMGSMRITLKLDDVVGVGRPGKDAGQQAPASWKKEAGRDTDLELDMRGMRAEESLDLLEKQLDTMMETGDDRPLRIIHGKGTGALRMAVKKYLSESPYIGEFRAGEQSEGGDGVTVAKLKG